MASEISGSARSIYTANFGSEGLTASGIEELDVLPPHTLQTAGFPCPSFTQKFSREVPYNIYTSL